jgi:hypothetical protein
LLSKIAGLSAARPAFDETRYSPPIVVGHRRPEVTPGPAGGDEQAPDRSERESCFHVGAVLSTDADDVLEFIPKQHGRRGCRAQPRDDDAANLVAEWSPRRCQLARF